MSNIINMANTEPILQTAGIGIYIGSGTPTFSANKGSLYINITPTTTTDRLFVNTDGSTTWAYFTASA